MTRFVVEKYNLGLRLSIVLIGLGCLYRPLLLGILAMGVILISELAFLDSFIQNDAIFPLFLRPTTYGLRFAFWFLHGRESSYCRCLTRKVCAFIISREGNKPILTLLQIGSGLSAFLKHFAVSSLYSPERETASVKLHQCFSNKIAKQCYLTTQRYRNKGNMQIVWLVIDF